MRIKITACLIPIILFATTVFSQNDFRPGYYLKTQSDTVRGFVDYRSGGKSYTACDFKSTQTSSEERFNADQIAGYGFVGDKFFLSNTFQDNNNQQRRVFMEVIATGLLSLYRFENIYFIKKEDSELQKLVNTVSTGLVDGKRIMRNGNEYIATLNIMMGDCPNIRSQVQRARLTESSLVKLVENYNLCKGSRVVAAKSSKPWFRAEPGIMVGYNISEINFITRGTYDQHLNGTFDHSKSPVIGLSVDFRSPRANERLSLHMGVVYLSQKYQRNYESQYFIGNTFISSDKTYVLIELTELKVPLAVRYTFAEKKFTPFFNLGISNTFMFNKNSYYSIDHNYQGTITSNSGPALQFSSVQFGFLGGIGVMKSISDKLNAFVELRFEQTNGVLEKSFDLSALTTSTINNYQFTIGVKLK